MSLFKIFNDVVTGTTVPTTSPTTPEDTGVSQGLLILDKIIKYVINWCKTDGIRLVFALILLMILFKITNSITKKLRRRLESKNVDRTLTQVIPNLIKVFLKVLWVLLFLGFIGVETASVGTIIASLSVCIGLAIQGSLSNLAGGIVILFMRPFRIGDFIKAQGESGTVEAIKIFYTYIVTGDNRTVMIPNGTLANGVIVNNNLKDTRRVDLVFGVSYESDIKLAQKTIIECAKEFDCILKDKEVMCRVSNHGESAIEITTRIWVNRSDYWDVYYGMMENVKAKFDELGIEIPYNKIDVNIKK